MRDLKELNIDRNSPPVPPEPPGDVQIANFQSQFGVVLPDEYLVFLRHSNGGYPKLSAFKAEELDNGSAWEVDHFYHLNDDPNDTNGIWARTRGWRSVMSGNVVAIGTNANGDPLLLSFDQAPPSVKLCLHEEMRLIHVANSFGEFIDMLEEYDMGSIENALSLWR